MISRDEAIKYLNSMINGTHDDSTHNHYADAKTAMNKIYDEFEREVTLHYETQQDEIEQNTELIKRLLASLPKDKQIEIAESVNK